MSATNATRIFLLLVGVLVGSPGAQAQTANFSAADTAGTSPRKAARPERNSLRLDVGLLALANLVYVLDVAFFGPEGRPPHPPLPLLASYERAVGNKFSIVGEGIVSIGIPEENTKGVSVQLRWYALPTKASRQILTGVYLAPVVGYRCIDVEQFSLYRNRNYLGGYGILGGIQCHPRHQMPRLTLDVSVGIMGWRAVHPARIKGMPEQYSVSSFPVVNVPYRLEHAGVPDFRFGVGWTF